MLNIIINSMCIQINYNIDYNAIHKQNSEVKCTPLFFLVHLLFAMKQLSLIPWGVFKTSLGAFSTVALNI